MDYREQAFIEKFKNASIHFNVMPNQIISLKFRENVSSYSEYQHLLDTLKHEAGISYQKLNDNFQGAGYILTDSSSKVIIVEHETGLEILYIAGSIASLVGIIPLIMQGWSSLRGHFGSRHNRDLRNIEIRKLDEQGHIQEDHVHETGLFSSISLPNSIFISATQNMETEIIKLKQEVEMLNGRIKVIEKNTSKQNKKKIQKINKSNKK